MSGCHSCRAELLETPWGELCGACALALGMSSERERVGDYELFQVLGEGSMGVVYLAKHLGSDDVVALKLARRELLERPGGLQLFRRQAKLESALQHPNIVQVRSVGTHEGRPFSIMPLMEGGTLAEAARVGRFTSPRTQLAVVLGLARAVQFAHERGVLHCDLKPENILFDAAFQPHVSDFGLSRSIDAADAEDGPRGGTRGWMSPEQVRGEALTTASDVFALGTLLHWLATGSLPFGDGPDFEPRLLSQPAPRLRPWTPELAWSLEAIAQRALQPAPEQRYPSAAALVDDLERAASERALAGQRLPPWGRAWRWAQRHPGARNAIFLLLPCFALLTLLTALAQRDELRRAVLDMNAYAASGQAAAVLYQLREYADIIEAAAADPAVRALTRGPRRAAAAPAAPGQDPCRTQTAFEDPAPLLPYAPKFASLVVLDADGCARARLAEEQPAPDYLRTNYSWRDYFSAALADASRPERTTHVRMAYRSVVSLRIKFAVSTPLFDDERWIGVVTGSITAASTLELPRTSRGRIHEQLTVLLGPFESASFERQKPEPGPREYTFLVHPRLGLGQKVALDAATARRVEQAFRGSASDRQFELGSAAPLQQCDYSDPLLGGRWLAAFAPVGRTGYVVLVQTRDDVATRPTNGLLRVALSLAGGSAAWLLTWGCFWVWQRRRERPA